MWQGLGQRWWQGLGRLKWPRSLSPSVFCSGPPRRIALGRVGDDWAPGQLIVSRDSEDAAAADLLGRVAEGEVQDFSVLDSLSERLARLDLPSHADLGLDTRLIAVPDGEEISAIAELMGRYLELRIDRPYGRASLLATPNAQMRIASVCATRLRPGDRDASYLEMMNAHARPAPGATLGTAVALLDSGIDTCGEFNVRRAANFIDDDHDVTDQWGHGTAVATLIRQLAPDAELYVAKVANDQGRVSEWDVLAALHLPPDVQVVNISLAFPLAGVDCPHCGRHSHVSRSRVFERILKRVCDADQQPLIVAAAGNDRQSQLAFPARFRDVIAVSSVTSSGALSPFSNHGVAAHDGKPHPNRFVLPGGAHESTEWVVEDPTTNKHWVGTSFAAGYASGIILNVIGADADGRPSNDDVLDRLKLSADRSSSNYALPTHGHGVMQLPSAW
jgi:hypothetical protein